MFLAATSVGACSLQRAIYEHPAATAANTQNSCSTRTKTFHGENDAARSRQTKEGKHDCESRSEQVPKHAVIHNVANETHPVPRHRFCVPRKHRAMPLEPHDDRSISLRTPREKLS